MGRPSATRKERATQERLLQSALIEFGERGFQAARLEDIGRRVGVRRSSLLYHWPSKRALYQATVQTLFYDLSVELSKAMVVQGTFEAKLDALVQYFADYLDVKRWAAPLLIREVMDGTGPGHALLVEEVGPLFGQVEKFLRTIGKGKIRPRLPVRAVLMQVVSSVLLRSAARDLAADLWGPKDVTRELTRLLVLEESK